MPNSATNPDLKPDPAAPDWLGVVTTKVRALRFGVVQITVHEGRVTQVEVAERTRFPSPHTPRVPDPD
jgi:hypothetical protein